MLEQLKAIFKSMGQGLCHQDLDEMLPTAEKLSQIERRSQNYRLSGRQGRIVLIASTDPMGPAFDFVVELAKQTKSLIEVLYIRPADETKSTLNTLLYRLGDMACDFQISFQTGYLLENISNYGAQRQDIMAVVCSSSEVFTEDLKSARQTLNPAMRNNFPAVLFVGDMLLV